MTKGYWVAHVSSDDASSFQSDAYKAYVAGAAPVFEQFGGKFLARGGDFENVEGADLGSRHVLIEFPSFEAAQSCYHSDTYSDAKQHRQSVANATIILVKGFE